LDVVRLNAQKLGLTNVNPVTPDDVPDDVMFTTIWSNPPIRIGKDELHNILTRWLPRLEPGSDAWLVVQRNLGSDSLQRWIEATMPELKTTRQAISKGYRVLRSHRPARAARE
jgi:16S rRNA G1207 methylase RsmC